MKEGHKPDRSSKSDPVAKLPNYIRFLDDNAAVQILQSHALSCLLNRSSCELGPDFILVQELITATGITPEANVMDGDLARASLLLLAKDPLIAPKLNHALEQTQKDREFGFVAPGLGVLVIVVLQSQIDIIWDKDVKWTFKFKKEALKDPLMKDVIAKLGGWMGI
jgi:hypothetical protein